MIQKRFNKLFEQQKTGIHGLEPVGPKIKRSANPR